LCQMGGTNEWKGGVTVRPPDTKKEKLNFVNARRGTGVLKVSVGFRREF